MLSSSLGCFRPSIILKASLMADSLEWTHASFISYIFHALHFKVHIPLPFLLENLISIRRNNVSLVIQSMRTLRWHNLLLMKTELFMM